MTADFNEDDVPDLAVTDDINHTVSVFLGDGQGGYESELPFPVAKDPESIRTADLDEDGHQDLVLVHDDHPNVSILWGNGNGTFECSTWPLWIARRTRW